MSIKLEVWGDRACFTRPEFRAERVSYDVMTPSAAIGILRSIYWHPGMYYVIDKIHVINPIKTTSIMVNEVRDKANASAMRRAMMANTTDDCHILLRGSARQQRTTLMLRDVRYIIEAHFELEDNPKGLNPDKVQSLIGKRSLAGACYNQPYFGLRENVAHFRQYEGKVVVPEEARITKDLGLMFHSYDYTDPQDPKPMFFQAKLVDGTITIPPVDSEEVFK